MQRLKKDPTTTSRPARPQPSVYKKSLQSFPKFTLGLFRSNESDTMKSLILLVWLLLAQRLADGELVNKVEPLEQDRGVDDDIHPRRTQALPQARRCVVGLIHGVHSCEQTAGCD